MRWLEQGITETRFQKDDLRQMNGTAWDGDQWDGLIARDIKRMKWGRFQRSDLRQKNETAWDRDQWNGLIATDISGMSWGRFQTGDLR